MTMTMNYIKNLSKFDKMMFPTLYSAAVMAIYFLFVNAIINFLYTAGAVLLISSIIGIATYLKEHSRIKNASEFTSPFGEHYKVARPTVAMERKETKSAYIPEKRLNQSVPTSGSAERNQRSSTSDISGLEGITFKKPKKNNF